MKQKRAQKAKKSRARAEGYTSPLVNPTIFSFLPTASATKKSCISLALFSNNEDFPGFFFPRALPQFQSPAGITPKVSLIGSHPLSPPPTVVSFMNSTPASSAGTKRPTASAISPGYTASPCTEQQNTYAFIFGSCVFCVSHV